MRILIAEDEVALCRALVKIFERNNYSADAVYNGMDALDYIEVGNYDVLILDVMMPKLDGISVLRRLREHGSSIPVLLLTAKSEVADKVLGLDSGANYYLTKPFDTRELLAAVRAITRGKNDVDSKIYFGNVSLDRATHELSSATASLKLANREFQMMEMLMQSPKTIISAERFMEKIWGFDTESEINVIWVYISYLRRKLSTLSASFEIRSSRNAGYYLEDLNDKKDKA